MKLAAIDIGSNAVRLLIVNAFEKDGQLFTQKDLMVRVPLRLGDQVFLDGAILPNKVEKLKKTMQSFRNMMDVCSVEHYKACATSAMRDAANGKEVMKMIKKQAKIEIDVISGKKESEIIYQSLKPTLENHPDDYFINIDVGGGSTELIVLNGPKVIGVKSFQIGTIRLLNDMVEENEWDNMKNWLKKHIDKKISPIGFGTGGNIRKLKKLYLTNEDFFSYPKMVKIVTHINDMSLKDRMAIYSLRYDRADVIAPASEIYLQCMKWGNIKKLFVPKAAGLVSGIINELFEERKKL